MPPVAPFLWLLFRCSHCDYDRCFCGALFHAQNQANKDLKGKTRNEIIETLDLSIDDYKSVLKTHGVLTTIGGFGIVLSSASMLLDALMGFSGVFAAGLAIAGALIPFTAYQVAEQIKNTREPIAFIYDVENLG